MEKKHGPNYGKKFPKNKYPKFGMRGKHLSEETKKKLSLACMGRIPWNKGTKGLMPQAWNKGLKSKFSGKNHPNWNGGKYKNYDGYILIRHNSKYIREHCLVMEKKLGRQLVTKERVHHINGIKTDNRIENLYLFRDASAHTSYHHNVKATYKKWGIEIVF